MKRPRIRFISLLFLFVITVFSCKTGLNKDKDDLPADEASVLSALGVDTGRVAARTDANGNVVPAEKNPFGSQRTVLSKDCEISSSGAYYGADSGKKPPVFSTYNAFKLRQSRFGFDLDRISQQIRRRGSQCGRLR